jgi:hypothetical protein
MAVRTAKGGKADWSVDGVTYSNVPEVRTFDLNPATEAKEYASSSTAGAKKRLEGTDDFDLTITLYVDGTNRFDAGTFNIRSGEVGYFKLWEDATDFFIAPVYIDDVSYTVDIEGGEIVSADISASGNGQLTYPT